MNQCVNKEQVAAEWTEDIEFGPIRKRFMIPAQAENWSPIDVYNWLDWATVRFNLVVNKSNWWMNGEKLVAMPVAELEKLIVPVDAASTLWTHVQILKQTGKCTIPRPTRQMSPPKNEATKNSGRVSSGNRSGLNGQKELWVFLLELLMEPKHKTIIQWIKGTEWEFEMLDKDRVAALWGLEKNNRRMNYEKMSRALRYYKRKQILVRTRSKKPVFKFQMDLKHLLGFECDRVIKLLE